jgi:hypothetical protein
LAVLALVLLAGCGSRAERRHEDEQVIVVPDPDEPLWDYRLPLPADFVKRTDLVPIDSRTEVWNAPGLELSLGLDSYAGRTSCLASPCRQWHQTIAGRQTHITRDAHRDTQGPNHSLNVYMPLIERHGHVTLAFTAQAGCATEAACERALELVRKVEITRRTKP